MGQSTIWAFPRTKFVSDRTHTEPQNMTDIADVTICPNKIPKCFLPPKRSIWNIFFILSKFFFCSILSINYIYFIVQNNGASTWIAEHPTDCSQLQWSCMMRREKKNEIPRVTTSAAPARTYRWTSAQCSPRTCSAEPQVLSDLPPSCCSARQQTRDPDARLLFTRAEQMAAAGRMIERALHAQREGGGGNETLHVSWRHGIGWRGEKEEEDDDFTHNWNCVLVFVTAPCPWNFLVLVKPERKQLPFDFCL